MQLGRQWSLPPVPPGAVYLHEDAAEDLGVKEGDHIYVKVRCPAHVLSLTLCVV